MLVPPQQAENQGRIIELKTIAGWFTDSVKAESWRDRAEEDAEFLANIQWTKEQIKDMDDRGQAPLVLNHIHRDYYIQLGRQIRNRMDPGVKPRGNADVRTARALQDVVKYLLDVNNWDYEQAEAIKDQLVVRGWLKVCYQNEDLTKEHIQIRHVPWREMRVDPSARRHDLSDAKFLFHEKWVDKEDIKAMFPEQALNIDNLCSHYGKSTQDQPAVRYESYNGDPYAAAIDRGEATKDEVPYVSKDRAKARVVECWYRVKTNGWQLKYADGRVVHFDPMDPQQAMDRMDPRNMLTFGPYDQVMYVIYVGNVILAQGKSPYSHGMYPYFRMEAFRADVQKKTELVCPNEPFGMVRIAKDPQRLLNSTYSKIRHILNTRQVVMGPGAADRTEVEANASDPGGIIELQADNARFEFVDQLSQAGHLTNLLDRSTKQFEAASGINEAARGMGPEQSGRALWARQQQSEVTNTVLSYNQRQTIIMIGKALVSMIQQSMTAERVVRITEDVEDRIIAINVNDPARAAQLQAEGVQDIYGSVSQGAYDVVVTDIESSVSRKEMDNQLIMTIVQNLDPMVQMMVLDMLIENTELRNREEFIRRIKALQGMAASPPPGPAVPGVPPEGVGEPAGGPGAGGPEPPVPAGYGVPAG